MTMLPSTGWIPDIPDERDYTVEHEKIHKILKGFGIHDPSRKGLPVRVDLRAFFPEVFQQGQTDSCTAQAAAGLMACLFRVAHGQELVPSRLFIYRTARDLIFQPYDNGVFARTAMKALCLFGAPPEAYWPFIPQRVNLEPLPFCYALASNFQVTHYYRYDRPGLATADVLARIRINLAGKLPAIFGLYVCPPFLSPGPGATVAFPTANQTPMGAHALVAAGYDDDMVIANPLNGEQTKGALLIRNSWGTGWGDGGYGWLPYRYVLDGYTSDWWSLIHTGWANMDVFGLDAPRPAAPSGGRANRPQDTPSERTVPPS